jgi:uncharacterized protein (DUF302 family)
MNAPAPMPPSVITLASSHDFETTVSRLKDVLQARNITLFADIDQSAAATAAGTSLRPTRLLLFGNPKAGTPIMQLNPHAALELPLRAVVWEDEAQRVYLDYLDVTQVLGTEYGIDAAQYAPLSAMPKLLQAVAGS